MVIPREPEFLAANEDLFTIDAIEISGGSSANKMFGRLPRRELKLRAAAHHRKFARTMLSSGGKTNAIGLRIRVTRDPDDSLPPDGEVIQHFLERHAGRRLKRLEDHATVSLR